MPGRHSQTEVNIGTNSCGGTDASVATYDKLFPSLNSATFHANMSSNGGFPAQF